MPMHDQVLAFFGFSRLPFGKHLKPADIFPSETHQEALSRLSFGVADEVLQEPARTAGVAPHRGARAIRRTTCTVPYPCSGRFAFPCQSRPHAAGARNRAPGVRRGASSGWAAESRAID